MRTSVTLFLISCLFFGAVFHALFARDWLKPRNMRLPIALSTIFATVGVGLWVSCTVWSVLAVVAAVVLAAFTIQEDKLESVTSALGRLRFALYILAVITSAALVYVFVPIATFLSSPGEISVHLDYLVSVNARDAMVIAYVAALLYAFAVRSQMRTMLTLVALSGLAVGLVYSFALPFGYPAMSGLTFETVSISGSTRLLRAALDGAIVLAATIGSVWAVHRYGARRVVVTVCLLNVSLTAMTIVNVRRDRIGTAGGATAGVEQSLQPLRFSTTHPNVLVLFLDRFMGSYIESIVMTDPGLADRLEGFVWFPRTLSAGENSIAGVHPMLGGYDYLPVEMNKRGKSLREQSVEAYSILPYNFSRNGYQVNVVSPRGLGFTMAGDCEFLRMERVTCTHIPMAVVAKQAQRVGFSMTDLSKSNYVDLLVLLGAMRSAPYVMKDILLRKGPWRPFLDHSAGTTFTAWAELHSLGELSAVAPMESHFNIVSNILPHEPKYMGPNCVPLQEVFEPTAAEVRASGYNSLSALQHAVAARCALLAVGDYLDFLKSSGAYHNTKIAIVSDHGIKGDVEDHSARAVAGGTTANLYVRTRSLLLVKERGATGPLQISETFLPNAELPRIVCEEIGGCVNPYLAGHTIEAHGRDDPFHVSFVPWQFSLQRPNAFVIRSQLVLRGRDPFSADGWSKVDD